jgi:hypothetical protein
MWESSFGSNLKEPEIKNLMCGIIRFFIISSQLSVLICVPLRELLNSLFLADLPAGRQVYAD